MTKLYEDGDPVLIDHPDRKGLRNFTWTLDAINDWEDIWHTLWKFGYKWEWQNADRYARRYGDTFKSFCLPTMMQCAWTWQYHFPELLWSKKLESDS